MAGHLIIPDRVRYLLEHIEFLCVATMNSDGSPCVANKFLVHSEKNNFYFADFAKGKTWNNLRRDPRVSVAVMDNDQLIDYQLNGKAYFIDSGTDYKDLLSEYSHREVRFTTKRIIESLRNGKQSLSHQLPLLKKVVIWKVVVEEILTLIPTEELKSQQPDTEQR